MEEISGHGAKEYSKEGREMAEHSCASCTRKSVPFPFTYTCTRKKPPSPFTCTGACPPSLTCDSLCPFCDAHWQAEGLRGITCSNWTDTAERSDNILQAGLCPRLLG